jgi:hypothetical protein
MHPSYPHECWRMSSVSVKRGHHLGSGCFSRWKAMNWHHGSASQISIVCNSKARSQVGFRLNKQWFAHSAERGLQNPKSLRNRRLKKVGWIE